MSVIDPVADMLTRVRNACQAGHRRVDMPVSKLKVEISRMVHRELSLALEGETIVVKRPSDESRHKALHGLTRTLVNNMVDGVTKGFAKTLEIQGVGYKAEPKPFGVQLVVGFSHPVPYHAPQGIKIAVENDVLVKVEGV